MNNVAPSDVLKIDNKGLNSTGYEKTKPIPHYGGEDISIKMQINLLKRPLLILTAILRIIILRQTWMRIKTGEATASVTNMILVK